MFPLRRALTALAISMAVPFCAAQAATFNIPSGDVAALKSAINAANASAETDTIDLNQGTYVFDTGQDTDTGATALPTITSGGGALTINGNGSTLSASKQQGTPFFRALKIASGADLTIGNVSINGFSNSSAGFFPGVVIVPGGAIENLGTLSLTGCTLGGNFSLSGSAISNEGTLTVADSAFIANISKAEGAIKNSGTATLTNTNFRNNSGGTSGAISNSGQLTLNRGILSSNQATGGSAINNSGTLTVSEATFQGNTGFGNVISNTSTMNLRSSLLIGSSSKGGLFSNGTLNVANTTITGGNSVDDGFNVGSAVTLDGTGTATFDSCTVTGNGEIRAIGIAGGTLTLRNSIVAGNGSRNAEGQQVAADIQVFGSGQLNSAGNNLIGSATGISGLVSSDQSGTDAAPLAPVLSELRDNGGPTLTFAVLAGSPALNKGDTALTTDQRGLPRPVGSADDIGAFEAQTVLSAPRNFVVTTTLDDEKPNDGLLSLREAINQANADDGANTIRFAQNVRGAITLDGNLPTLLQTTTIEGPGARLLAIDGAGKDNILFLNTNGTVTISGLTLRNGNGLFAADNGGGAPGGAIGTNDKAFLILRDCSIENNTSYSGGAISSSGGLFAERCTFSGNSSIEGGAINASGASLLLRNCTLSGNSAIAGRFSGAGAGSGIYTRSAITRIESSTIVANAAPDNSGGGVAVANSSSPSVAVSNSIIFGNGGGDVRVSSGNGNPFTSGGNNLIGNGNASPVFNKGGDRIGVDPKIGPLADNGGATQTRALLLDSPAIDKGDTDLTTDQRGLPRPQGAADDIGAYEVQAATAPESPSLTVTTASDVVANDGQTSLREAINYANTKAGADTINFADNVRGKLTLSALLPQIASEITLDGPGAPNLAIDGGGQVRLLNVAGNATLTINGLTLSGALYDAAEGPGGAIFNRGNLNLNYCVLTANTGIEGGAITNLDGTVTMQGTLVSGNTALTVAGALLNNNGVVTAINSTIANNTVTSSDGGSGGGAISTYGDKARVTFDCVTLTGNSAPNANGNVRAGVWMEGGVFVPHNSILSGNGARDLQVDGGTLSSAGYNIVGVTSANTRLAGSDLIGIHPNLGELSDNGGPTKTRALLEGSPAINSGDPAITAGFDQRGGGFPRVRGGRVDIGAFEVQSDAVTFSVSLSPVAPKTNDTLKVNSAQALDGAIFVWRKNGAIIQNETSATLNLAKAGNGDKKDVISVEVSQNSSSAVASVTIVNSVPVAVSSQGVVDVDTEKGFPLLGFDPDGDPVDFIRVGGPRNGVKAEIRKGDDGITRLFYRSRPKYGGVDIIRFVLRDNEGKISNESTLGITVLYTPPAPVNRKPIAGNTNIDTFVNTSVIKGLLGSDPDGDPITFRIVNNAKYGKSEIKRDTDGFFKLFYTSLNKFYGPDRVTYIAVDSRGAESNIATVNINFTNRKPVAQGNKLTVASGEAVSQYLFGTDEDADVLSFRLINNPQHGTGEVKRDESGAWRVYYQSYPGYVGPDQITFIAIDPMGRESFSVAAEIDVVRVAGTPSVPSAAKAGNTPSGGSS